MDAGLTRSISARLEINHVSIAAASGNVLLGSGGMLSDGRNPLVSAIFRFLSSGLNCRRLKPAPMGAGVHYTDARQAARSEKFAEFLGSAGALRRLNPF